MVKQYFLLEMLILPMPEILVLHTRKPCFVEAVEQLVCVCHRGNWKGVKVRIIGRWQSGEAVSCWIRVNVVKDQGKSFEAEEIADGHSVGRNAFEMFVRDPKETAVLLSHCCWCIDVWIIWPMLCDPGLEVEAV